jgi:phosphoglycerate kinase
VKQFYGMVQQVILKIQILLKVVMKLQKKLLKKNKNKSIYSVAGGGDTIAVLNQINAINNFNFVSTAGGAFLEYLEGKELPGIKALN